MADRVTHQLSGGGFRGRAVVWKESNETGVSNAQEIQGAEAVGRSRDDVDDLLMDEHDLPTNERVSGWISELFRTWGPAILIVLLIRSVVAEPFRIPSGSMVPTLEIGDFILVSKFSYGVRVPFTQKVLLDMDEPKRGDVVVFGFPDQPSQAYIKRIVGLPGDIITTKSNTLYVNGVAQTQQSVGAFSFVDDECRTATVDEKTETIDGRSHRILTSANPAGDFGPNTYSGGQKPDYVPAWRWPDDEFKVPADTFFAMGDNRDNSSDSRVWGTVPRANLKGRAILVWLSWDHCTGNIPFLGRFRFDRIGTMLN